MKSMFEPVRTIAKNKEEMSLLKEKIRLQTVKKLGLVKIKYFNDDLNLQPLKYSDFNYKEKATYNPDLKIHLAFFSRPYYSKIHETFTTDMSAKKYARYGVKRDFVRSIYVPRSNSNDSIDKAILQMEKAHPSAKRMLFKKNIINMASRDFAREEFDYEILWKKAEYRRNASPLVKLMAKIAQKEIPIYQTTLKQWEFRIVRKNSYDPNPIKRMKNETIYLPRFEEHELTDRIIKINRKYAANIAPDFNSPVIRHSIENLKNKKNFLDLLYYVKGNNVLLKKYGMVYKIETMYKTALKANANEYYKLKKLNSMPDRFFTKTRIKL